MMNSAANNNNNNKENRRMIPLRFVLTPIAIILFAIVGLIVFAALAPKPAKKPAIIKAPLVEVQAIERQDVRFTIASQGSVLPRTQTNLVSEVSGQITSVNEKFNVGGFFKKGEVLLSIDDISYQVSLLQAQSRLDAAKSVLIEEQARKDQAEDEWMLSGKTLSEAPILALRLPQLQKAQADIKAAKADVTDAEVKLTRTKIVAPYDAIVKEKQVDIGQYVTTGAVLAKTFAVDYAEVRLPIKQRDVDFLNLPKINQKQNKLSKVDIHYQLSGVEHTWAANLTRYEGEVDSRSRVHYVIAQVDDPYSVLSSSDHQELRMGTFVNANISGKVVNDIVTIPRDALRGANKIYLVDSENRLHIQEIKVLRNDVDYVYSYDKFSAGLRLVMTQMEAPVEGMALRIVGEPEEMPAAEDLDDIANAQGDDS
ncbi:efflux RND transporter periplasmic adaptor subunit [Colwellia sp. M166]|uniref:efflux RND transporter periplasmic adaptor subunit n=1 Tax=Colwellia sp. M166 TaxID=2583805 RepID=UPI00211F0464|nr:efflux RND transporter periplasmic adaptor subunit [Colwellia sp. M166]UUO24167.1 efflux RND transporter periplasmic adaptor subunit [Colwellia sp. M166]|tara:strand:- start:60305 stop:61579 length:1275 start_codon:yes stop_codon:yes gene_type:complete